MQPSDSPLTRNSLKGLFVQHKTFLGQAQSCILTDISANQQNDKYKEFLLFLSKRIESHKARLESVEKNQDVTDAEDGVQWGPIEAMRISRDNGQIVFKIHGPASGDEHLVQVKGEEEAFKLVRSWTPHPIITIFTM